MFFTGSIFVEYLYWIVCFGNCTFVSAFVCYITVFAHDLIVYIVQLGVGNRKVTFLLYRLYESGSDNI